jgi:hypothetical protein
LCRFKPTGYGARIFVKRLRLHPWTPRLYGRQKIAFTPVRPTGDAIHITGEPIFRPPCAP